MENKWGSSEFIENERARIVESLEDSLSKNSNEIPTKIVHGDGYKVTKNWFQGTLTKLELAVECGLLSERLIEGVKDLLEKFAIKKMRKVIRFLRKD